MFGYAFESDSVAGSFIIYGWSERLRKTKCLLKIKAGKREEIKFTFQWQHLSLDQINYFK